MDPVLSPAGGAVCWANNVDCVAWGSFSAPNALPVAPGPPFNAPTGLVPDMAMHRTLSAGGAVTAFTFAAPAPKNNAGEVTAPTQTPTSPSEATPTATPTSVVPTVCAGDCDRSGIVDTGELITLSNIALGHANAAVCADGIPDGESVVVAVILQAVNRSLLGCGLTPERQGCIDSGGTVSSASCCTTAPDFPDTCAIGSCGCSPESSHPVHICACGVGACFDRTQRACVVP
jgi:hypothetical protein